MEVLNLYTKVYNNLRVNAINRGMIISKNITL